MKCAYEVIALYVLCKYKNAIFAICTDIGTTDNNFDVFDIFEVYMLLLSEPHPNLYSNLIYPKKDFFIPHVLTISNIMCICMDAKYMFQNRQGQ